MLTCDHAGLLVFGPQLHEDMITLKGIASTVRQIAIRNIDRDQPTLLINNEVIAQAKDLFARYTERMIIENELGTYSGGFHLDALTSAIPRNVDFDTTLTCALNLRSHHPILIDAGYADLDISSPGGTTAPYASASHPADHNPAPGPPQLPHRESWLERCVDDEVAVEPEQDAVGGEELQSSLAGLGDEEPIERVMVGELGKLANAFGVLRRDAQQGQSLLGEPEGELIRNYQLAEHGLDRQFPHGGRRDVNRGR